jgi:macrolide transport system ATP-binding/permease protein
LAPLIEIRGLRKVYRAQVKGTAGEDIPEVVALDSISLTIEKGEFVAIIGQSGSGKSTLMQILGLLDRKTAGDYRLDGVDVSALDDATLAALRSNKIGFVFQFFNLLPRTSATDNVALPMLYAGRPGALERARDLLRKVGMANRLTHKPHQLSGGQQQRVAIARALANEPELIFADEPTGNISSAQSEEILGMLEDLNRQGTTIILVTHEPDVAQRASRVITLKDGRVASDLRQRPFTPVVDNRAMAQPRPAAEAFAAPSDTSAPRWQRLRENLRMAFVSLSLNKMRTALATLGIIVGIASVVAMVAIGKGAQKAIEDQLASLGTNMLTIWPINPRNNMAGRGYRKFTVDDYETMRLMATPHSPYQNVGALIYGNVQVSYGARNSSTRIVGSTPSYGEMQNARLTAGHFFTEEENRGRQRVAILGQTVVRNLFGDSFNPIGAIFKVNGVEFRVIGVLEAKGSSSFQDADDQIIVPIYTTMYRVLGKSMIDNLTVSIKEDRWIAFATKELEDFLRQRRKLRPEDPSDFSIRSLNEVRDAVNKTTQAISSLLAVIASISLIVGGIGIMNVMLVSVKERTKEIGLRKALGARRKDVLFQFLVESILICLLGGVIGLALGYVISAVTSLVLGWGFVLSLSAALLAVIFSILVGLIFGIWPAKQASALSPIEALRYE